MARVIPQMALIGLLFFADSPVARGGILAQSSLHWDVFSIRPEHGDSPAINYYGVGPGVLAGYSFFQAIDLALFGEYLPGRRRALKIGKEDATIISTGVHLGLRLEQEVSLAVNLGQSHYHLVSRATPRDDLQGRWQGLLGGISFGRIYKIKSQHFIMLNIQISHILVKRHDIKASEVHTHPRRIDSFKIVLSYVFNQFKRVSR